MVRYLLAAIFGFSLLLAGCVTTGELKSISTSAGEDLLASIEKARVPDAQFVGQVKVIGPTLGFFPVNVQSDVVIQSPDRVHWAVRSFFGQPTHLLVVDGENGSWLDLISEGGPVLYTERPKYFLQTIFGLESLDIEDFIWLWWGRLPQHQWEIQEALTNVKLKIHVLFLLDQKGRKWQVTLNANKMIQQVKVSWGEKLLWTLEYEEFKTEKEITYPTKMKWQIAMEDQGPIRFHLEEGSVHEPTIAKEAFRPPDIPGVEIRPWIQGGF